MGAGLMPRACSGTDAAPKRGVMNRAMNRASVAMDSQMETESR